MCVLTNTVNTYTQHNVACVHFEITREGSTVQKWELVVVLRESVTKQRGHSFFSALQSTDVTDFLFYKVSVFGGWSKNASTFAICEL